MCLTEPHCGSDLGLLKTRAEPVAARGRRRVAGVSGDAPFRARVRASTTTACGCVVQPRALDATRWRHCARRLEARRAAA